MKIIFKVLFIFIGMGLLVSCSDDDDTGFVPEWDHSALSYEQNVEANALEADINFSAEGQGMIYYAIYAADATDDVTPAGLREEYGYASGNGISGQIDGGAITVDGSTQATFNFVGQAGQAYKVYSTSANEYDYVGELKVSEFETLCDINLPNNYQSYAFSEDLGMTIDNAFVDKPELTRVEGTCNEYLINSLWGQDFVAYLAGNADYNGLFVYPAKITINDDNTVTVTAASEDDSYVTGGEGTYNPTTHEIDVLVGQALFTSDFTVRVILKAP